MNFRLNQPCGSCPFRKDDFRTKVTQKNAKEISEALLSDQSLACHKTDRGLSGNMRNRMLEHCAGAIIMLEKQSKMNQAMRSAEREGKYDPLKMKMDSNVFESFDAFINANKE